MNRRSFFRRALAAVAVTVASPTALVAPSVWRRVQDWRGGYLNPEQSDRFVAMLLDDGYLAAQVSEVSMSSIGSKFRFRVQIDGVDYKPKNLAQELKALEE